jgi:hypothetical protein
MSFGIDHFARVCSRSESVRSIGLTAALLLEAQGAVLSFFEYTGFEH